MVYPEYSFRRYLLRLVSHSGTGILAVLLTLIVGLPRAQAGEDYNENMLGSWEMNMEKSVFDPGPAPQQETITWERTEDGIRNISVNIEADGTPRNMETVTRTGEREHGKRYPAAYQSPHWDSSVAYDVDAYRWAIAYFKDNLVVKTYTFVISTDKQELTIVAEGVDFRGNKYKNIKVYDRQ